LHLAIVREKKPADVREYTYDIQATQSFLPELNINVKGAHAPADSGLQYAAAKYLHIHLCAPSCVEAVHINNSIRRCQH
jgi:hypothetical protein